MQSCTLRNLRCVFLHFTHLVCLQLLDNPPKSAHKHKRPSVVESADVASRFDNMFKRQMTFSNLLFHFIIKPFRHHDYEFDKSQGSRRLAEVESRAVVFCCCC